jgi:hypothetical protein
VHKVVDVVGLYHNPPEKAVVLCVDEKSGMQALDRSQSVLPMMPGMPERRSHDYARHGVPIHLRGKRADLDTISLVNSTMPPYSMYSCDRPRLAIDQGRTARESTWRASDCCGGAPCQ